MTTNKKPLIAAIDINKYEVVYSDEEGVSHTHILWAMPTAIPEWLEKRGVLESDATVTQLAIGMVKGEEIQEDWWVGK